MAATAAEIARLRRMVTDTVTPYDYPDNELRAVIARYPVVDARGEAPWVESTLLPGTLVANDDWTATYDLNAAAAEVWGEKAAALAGRFDFSAEGASYTRSQAFEHAKAMERSYRSRRSAGTMTLRPEPRPDADDLLEK